MTENDKACSEIKYAVESCCVVGQDKLQMQIITKEGDTFCLSLSASGFTILQQIINSGSPKTKLGDCFETIYAFLDTVSAEYRNKFVESIADKLLNINKT